MLGLIFSALVLLMVIIQLDGVRTTLLANVPSAHSSLANLLVIIVALVGSITVTIALAVAGYTTVSRR